MSLSVFLLLYLLLSLSLSQLQNIFALFATISSTFCHCFKAFLFVRIFLQQGLNNGFSLNISNPKFLTWQITLSDGEVASFKIIKVLVNSFPS